MSKSILLYQLNELPSTIKLTLEDMPQNKVDAFTEDFNRTKKKYLSAYLFLFLLGAHYGYLGKWGMCVLFWLTAGGCGIWAIADLFRIPHMVDASNGEMAGVLIKNIR